MVPAGGAGVLDVGRKPKPSQGGKKPSAKSSGDVPAEGEGFTLQFNIRFDEETARALYETRLALGLDGANLIRLIVKQNLPRYVKQAEAIRRGESPPE